MQKVEILIEDSCNVSIGRTDESECAAIAAPTHHQPQVVFVRRDSEGFGAPLKRLYRPRVGYHETIDETSTL